MKFIKFFILVAVCAGSTFFLYNKIKPHIGKPLPILGKLDDFALTTQEGTSASLESFKGSTLLVNFIFTRCKGPCPLVTKKMTALQGKLKDLSHFKHISISMEPSFDTPEVLTQYGKKHQADFSRWTFLTGDLKEIIKLAKSSFKLPAGQDPDMHSTRMVLIDIKGQIRGYYDSFDEKDLAKLEKDARKLAG